MASGEVEGGHRGRISDQAAQVRLEQASRTVIAPAPTSRSRRSRNRTIAHNRGHGREQDRHLGAAGVHLDPGLLVVLALVHEQTGRHEALQQNGKCGQADDDAVQAQAGSGAKAGRLVDGPLVGTGSGRAQGDSSVVAGCRYPFDARGPGILPGMPRFHQ